MSSTFNRSCLPSVECLFPLLPRRDGKEGEEKDHNLLVRPGLTAEKWWSAAFSRLTWFGVFFKSTIFSSSVQHSDQFSLPTVALSVGSFGSPSFHLCLQHLLLPVHRLLLSITCSFFRPFVCPSFRPSVRSFRLCSVGHLPFGRRPVFEYLKICVCVCVSMEKDGKMTSTLLKVKELIDFNLFELIKIVFCLFPTQQEKVKFEDYWPNMRPVILRLLKQESVNNSEWQDLFW